MKKTLLILSLLTSAFFTVNAQCTPDKSQTDVGPSPENLPTSCINVSYDEDITLTLKRKFNFNGIDVDVSQITINRVTNLHSGLSYTCENNNCTIMIAENGLTHTCISIDGTPTEDGVKEILVEYTAKTQFGDVDNSEKANVTVKPASDPECNIQNTFDIQDKSNSLGVYPNPSNGQELNFNSTLHNVSIVDQLGNVVYTAEEAQSIRLQTATKGIYFLKADEGIEKIIIK